MNQEMWKLTLPFRVCMEHHDTDSVCLSSYLYDPRHCSIWELIIKSYTTSEIIDSFLSTTSRVAHLSLFSYTNFILRMGQFFFIDFRVNILKGPKSLRILCSIFESDIGT